MSVETALRVLVAERVDLPGNVMALRLVSSTGQPLPRFAAGAHVDVRIDAGMTRQYSLHGDPADDSCYRVAILNDLASRGGSRTLHQRVKIGEHLAIGQPRNHFPLAPEATLSVLIGGGIGITPMIAMAHSLYAEGRDFILHYCVTDVTKAAFAEFLLSAPFAERVVVHYSRSDAARPFNPLVDLPAPDNGVHIYCCGPAGFMDWVQGAAATAGYPASHLHREDFGADVDLSGASFTVEAQKSGKTVQVRDGQSIAHALAGIGITIDVSCEEGVCGTCLTDVIAGEIDHRDHYLNDEEKAEGALMLVCCSRARSSRLVLDL